MLVGVAVGAELRELEGCVCGDLGEVHAREAEGRAMVGRRAEGLEDDGETEHTVRALLGVVKGRHRRRRGRRCLERHGRRTQKRPGPPPPSAFGKA